LLAEGKTWTGFSDEEEDEVNKAFGMTLNDYTIQGEAARIQGTTYRCRGANEPFAIRDGRLITGQQQYSSGLTAELVLDALDE
jgi:putative intracellular protease/amidase